MNNSAQFDSEFARYKRLSRYLKSKHVLARKNLTWKRAKVVLALLSLKVMMHYICHKLYKLPLSLVYTIHRVLAIYNVIIMYV